MCFTRDSPKQQGARVLPEGHEPWCHPCHRAVGDKGSPAPLELWICGLTPCRAFPAPAHTTRFARPHLWGTAGDFWSILWSPSLPGCLLLGGAISACRKDGQKTYCQGKQGTQPGVCECTNVSLTSQHGLAASSVILKHYMHYMCVVWGFLFLFFKKAPKFIAPNI